MEPRNGLNYVICLDKSFFKIWFTHAVTFLIWFITLSLFDLRNPMFKNQRLIHLQLHKTYSLFFELFLNGLFLWHMIPASLSLKLFFKAPNKEKRKKETSKESRKILEYEMMNNRNSSPFIFDDLIYFEDKKHGIGACWHYVISYLLYFDLSLVSLSIIFERLVISYP